MELGEFSISLAVKDLQASKNFYGKLGFSVHSGEESEKWLILQNGGATIGLFQGMFDENILTFHPKDVRSVQKGLREIGITLNSEADETSNGPAHATLEDPDGNTILLDQF